MNRSNRVAETKALISFAQKTPFSWRDSSNFPQIRIRKTATTFLIGIIFRHSEPKRCRQNGKHCEPWWDLCLIWVYTICIYLSVWKLTRIITVRHLGKTERHKLTIPQKCITYRSKGVIFQSFSKTISWILEIESESRKVSTLAHFAQQLFLETNY